MPKPLKLQDDTLQMTFPLRAKTGHVVRFNYAAERTYLSTVSLHSSSSK